MRLANLCLFCQLGLRYLQIGPVGPQNAANSFCQCLLLPRHNQDAIISADMTQPDFSTVLVLDERSLRQLAQVWPTWRRFKPEIWRRPLLMVCDAQAGDVPWWERQLRRFSHPDRMLRYWDWPNLDDTQHAGMTQRERMLTAWVRVPPRVVETEYWLKIDTDVVATSPKRWIRPEWFRQKPALIASSWGYSKPANIPGDLDAWGNQVEPVKRYPPLDLPAPRPDQGTIKHPRIASWVAWIHTGFSQWADNLAGSGRLPVPSQDSYHWYLAHRCEKGVEKVRMKEHGWATRNSNRGRMKLIDEVMGGCCG